MKKHLIEFRNNFIIVSIAFIILGLVLIIFPEKVGELISYICGTVLSVLGIIHITDYIRKKKGEAYFNFTLARGIIELILGIFLFVNPTFLPSVFPFVLGIIVLIDSIVKIQNSMDMKRAEKSDWIVVLCFAVLGIILGVFMIINPFTSAKLTFIFIGVALIISAISDLYSVFRISQRIKEIKASIQDKTKSDDSTIDVDDYTVVDENEK